MNIPALEPLPVFAAREPSLAEVVARYKAFNAPLAAKYKLPPPRTSLVLEVRALKRAARGTSPEGAMGNLWEALLKIAERLETAR